MSHKFSIIVATDSNHGIAREGIIPWDSPADRKFFKDLTKTAEIDKSNAVIMGRATWESLPSRPLFGRYNIVISSQRGHSAADYIVSNLEQALHACNRDFIDRAFVIGGEQVYRSAIGHPDCDAIYRTSIEGNYDCDRFFPPIPMQTFRLLTNYPLAGHSFHPRVYHWVRRDQEEYF